MSRSPLIAVDPMTADALAGQRTMPEAMRPAKQARSRATRDKLIEAGSRLVEERDFESLSVAELAAAAGCSVGGFYFRFSDKEGFFKALSIQMLGQPMPDLGASNEPIDIEEIAARLISFLVTTYRSHRGLLRAAIRMSMIDRTIWEPFKDQGYRLASTVADRLNGYKSEEDVRFAMQVLYATLNHTILLAPGPLTLEDEKFSRQLARVFVRVVN